MKRYIAGEVTDLGIIYPVNAETFYAHDVCASHDGFDGHIPCTMFFDHGSCMFLCVFRLWTGQTWEWGHYFVGDYLGWVCEGEKHLKTWKKQINNMF